MTLSHQNDDQSIAEAVRHLIQRYGTAARGVAQEWADIKYRQGAPQTAAVWLRIASSIEQTVKV